MIGLVILRKGRKRFIDCDGGSKKEQTQKPVHLSRLFVLVTSDRARPATVPEH